MGCNLKDLASPESIELGDLAGQGLQLIPSWSPISSSPVYVHVERERWTLHVEC